MKNVQKELKTKRIVVNIGFKNGNNDTYFHSIMPHREIIAKEIESILKS